MPITTVDPDVRSIEIVAGTPPGGGQDRAARALAAALAAAPGVAVTVTNLVGDGGGVAWASLSDRRRDGSVISISSPTLLSNHIHDGSQPGPDDVTHLAILCTEPLAFVLRADSPIAGPEGLLDRLGDDPGGVRVAIATAIGNVNHIAAAQVARHVGARSVSVEAFSSARHAVTEVIERRATLAVVSAASVVSELKAGAVRVIALSADQHLGPPFDGVPIWTDVGVACTAGTWRGAVGPPDLAPDVVTTLGSMLSAAVETTQWRAAIEEHLWIPRFMFPEGAVEFTQRESVDMRRTLSSLGQLDG